MEDGGWRRMVRIVPRGERECISREQWMDKRETETSHAREEGRAIEQNTYDL